MARILIIDDHLSLRLAIRQFVEWAGHEAVEAENGEQGIALQRENPADLVICDMIMPEKHGIDTVVEIMRIDPKVPVIAISGGAMLGHLDYLPIARKLGVRRIIDKPFGMSQMLAAISDCLEETPPESSLTGNLEG